jgi:signal transduction histidine kinase
MMKALSLLSVLSLLLLLLAPHAAAEVKGGAIDFAETRWDRAHALSGEWRFFPYEFLSEANLRSPDFSLEKGLLVKVPAGVDSYQGIDGKKLDAQSWGTFVIELKNLRPPFLDLGLNVRGDTAYQVFALDLERPTTMDPILSVGKVGTSPETSIPQVASPLGLWRTGGSGHYLLVVHLSGFHYPWGGLWTSPKIGPYQSLATQHQLIFLSESLAAGMILVMMLHHLSLFMHRNEDKASLVLSVFSASILLRFLGSSPSIINAIFPEPSLLVFELVRKFEYAFLGILGACGAWFAMATFHLQTLRPLLRFEAGIGVAALIFCLVTPASFFPRFVVPLSLILLFQVATYLGIVAWAVMRRATGSKYLAVGGIVMAVTVVYDVLIGNGFVDSSIFLSPFGMIFLLFSNGQVVADLFASSFRTAQRLSLTLQEEVERKTRNIRTMLDHIPQGVMGIVAPGVADDEYSRHLKLILGVENVAGVSIHGILLDRSLLTADEKSRVTAALDSILNEDLINFEFNAAQLITELVLVIDNRKKHLQLDWAPLVNNQGLVEKIQLTIHDFTRVKLVEEQNEKQRMILGYIQELLHVSDRAFQVFAEATDSLLKDNYQLITGPRRNADSVIKALYINMHTLKGSARTLGLNQISALAHDIEQDYIKLLKDAEHPWQPQALTEQHDKLVDLVAQYRDIHRSILGREHKGAAGMALGRDVLEKLARLLHAFEPLAPQINMLLPLQDLLKIIEPHVFQNVSNFFPEIRNAVRSIARDLKRAEPHLIIDADGFHFSQAAENLLRKVMVHILRNALDHGIESPEERVQKGKGAAGTLWIACAEDGGRLRLSFQDDGRGLPLARLRARASQYGLPKDAADQDVADLVFQSGLSTASTVTEISGRGMGMEAIRLYLREVGGDATLELLHAEGSPMYCPFRLVISLPSSYYRRIDASPPGLAELVS